MVDTEYYYDVFASANLTSYVKHPGDASTCIILTYIASITIMVIYSYAIECNVHIELLAYLKKKRKFDTSESIYCVICMESNFSDFVELDCGHKFHINCLHKWMLVNPICPICRKEDIFCPTKKNFSEMLTFETPLVLL